MKNSKRILSIILSIAILLVSLPMSIFSAEGILTNFDDIKAHMDEYFTKNLYSLNLVTYTEGATPDGWEALGKNWGAMTTGASAKYATASGAKGVQLIASGTDNYTYIPQISDANYVYEATFVPTADSGSAGLLVNAASKSSGVTYAAVYAAKPSDVPWVHYWNRGLGEANRISLTPEGFTDIWSVGAPITMKMYVYEGIGYFYLNGDYMGEIPFASPQTGASYIGFYSSGANIIVTDLTVKGYEEPKELKIWNGSFDGALPTADKDGDGEIEITTPEEFAAVMKTNGKDADGNRIKYELTGDIYLNDTRVEGWKDNDPNHWLAPVKAEDITADNIFYGIVNGNGYVVRGVYVDKVYVEGEIVRNEFNTTDDADYNASDVLAEGSAPELDLYEDVYAGLFPVIGKGAAIVALGMEDSYISVRDSSAPIILKAGGTKDMSLIGSVGLVGVVANYGSNQAIIDQCYINDSVVLKGGRVAMVGCGNKTTEFIVSNSYASATVTPFTGTKTTGWDNNDGNRFMLVSGGGAYPTITGCYTYGNVCNNGTFNKTTAAGAAHNNVYFSSWSNTAYATQITWNNIVGDAAKTLMPKLDWTKFETVAGARPVLKVFTTHSLGTDGAVWDGTTTDSSATDGDGDGYLDIKTANQLAYAIANSKSAELLNDIWLNDIAVYAKGGFFLADRAPKAWLGNTYKANFNGEGHKVYGLFYNTEPTESVRTFSGLIPDLGGGYSIKNVGVEQAFIKNNSHYSMGAIAGATYNGNHTIDRCYVGESVYMHGYDGIGGISGGGSNTGIVKTFTNCYTLATIVVVRTSDPRTGGILGDNWNTGNYTIKNSFTTYTKLIGNGSATVSGTYAVGAQNVAPAYFVKVSDADMKGANALNKMPDLNADGAYQTTDSYPMLKIFDPNYVEEEEVGEVWNGSIAADFAGGTGTEADPYIIQKGSQLAKAINEFGLNGSYFKLDRDIYLNNIDNFANAGNSWFKALLQSDIGGQYYAYKGKVTENTITTTMGGFNGHIDGNGHYIYGLKYTDNSSQTAGLIPIMNKGSIKNLGVDHVKLNSGSYTGEEGTSEGVLIGRVYQKTGGMIYIDRCYIGSNVAFGGGTKSGMIGYATTNTSTNYVAISNSYVLVPASLLSTGKNGAFIADVWNTYYTLENVWSIGRPVNPGDSINRASQFYKDDTSKMGDYIKNVFSAADDLSGKYEVDGDYKLYTTLTDAQMRGANVFSNMNINGDDAFLYNIGYPTLKWQGNSVPSESDLLSGLINIATAMPMSEYKADTKVYIVNGEFVTGKEIAIDVAFGDKTATFKVAADGTATISCGETGTSKALTLSGTATYKLASVGNFLLAYVNGEFVGFVDFETTPGHQLTFTGFDLENDSICVDLYLEDVTFNAVDLSTDILLKDLYGKNNYGGIRFNTILGDTDLIDNMGYATDYGVLITVGDKIVEDITAENATKFPFGAQYDSFEFTGLGAKGQELFFSVRPYAEIVINDEISYYYYAPETLICSPIYEANDLYENEAYATDIKATYGASDKFIENYDQEINFTTFGDYHYNDGQYTSQLDDLKVIFDTAKENNSDFVLSLGDMSNDMVGSKEITNYLLNGKYSFRGEEIEKDHDFAFYNLYGNHELEASNRLTYVNQTLTNSDVHWGDGSVGPMAAVTLKYKDQTIENNDFEERNELATGSYYWFEQNGIRIIVTNNNFSWNPNHINGEVVGWEHALIGSYGSPTAANNSSRGFDEGAAALGNTQTSNLGPTQLAWLEVVLMDAVEKGIPCVIAGHGSYHPTIGGSASGADVRALFKKANSIRTGTVIAALNGHQHTNRQFVMDDVLYLDITTVRNSEWRSTSEAHYDATHTFTYDYYDDNGNWLRSETKQLNSLTMGKNTWFANDPVHSNVKITQRGAVELDGMKSSYMYDVIPNGYLDHGYPGQNSGYWNVGDASFTVTEYAYPAR